MKDRQPSDAKDPDLDWSQVRETVRMLQLSIAQIDISLREGDDSIQSLTDSFMSIIESVHEMDSKIKKLSIISGYKDLLDKISGESQKISSRVQQSIVAFQFYDKLSQRLSHVSHALDALAELVGDQTKLYNPNEWIGLQRKIRSRYSMREEQEMFDLLLSGASIDEALSKGLSVIHRSEDGDIEIF